MHLPGHCSNTLDHADSESIDSATDPRVQVELENLNTSTEFINKLELELEKARSEFNKLLCDSTQKIETLSKKLDKSITKARPYYETRITATELHQKAQEETIRYEQATEAHNKAKELVHLTEQHLNTQQESDSTNNCDTNKLARFLTNSADRVNQTELERLSAQRQHEITSRAYCLTEQKLTKMHNQLKRSIVKASLETRRNFLDLNNYANQHQLQLLPYFEMKSQFNQMLEEQVNKIRSYETRVNKAKTNYTKALQRLEDLNKTIFDNSEVDSTDEYMGLSEVKCPNNETIEKRDSSLNASTSQNIFDNKLLADLIIDDKIESKIEQLKSQTQQCLF